jgi:hypothetical protein
MDFEWVALKGSMEPRNIFLYFCLKKKVVVGCMRCMIRNYPYQSLYQARMVAVVVLLCSALLFPVLTA